MGRLEDELEKIGQELEFLDSSRTSEGREQYMARLKAIIGAIREGGDTSVFEVVEVNRVEEAMIRYSPAVENVRTRLAEKEGRLDHEDGGWRVDEPY
jgi:hypothetical protein